MEFSFGNVALLGIIVSREARVKGAFVTNIITQVTLIPWIYIFADFKQTSSFWKPDKRVCFAPSKIWTWNWTGTFFYIYGFMLVLFNEKVNADLKKFSWIEAHTILWPPSSLVGRMKLLNLKGEPWNRHSP